VGVVQDVRQYGPTQAYRPAIYQPYLQVRRTHFLNHVSYVVRTPSEPLRAVPPIRAALRAVDRDQPATSIVPMKDIMAAARAEPAFHARLLGTFAVLAVLLALVGTYGVLAYSVAQRTHEIGVRVALGARATTILWMVIRRTLLLSAAGVALGTLGAPLATRFLMTYLFETTPTDPRTFAGVSVLIVVAAFAAGFVPARRASRVDPLVALRHE
jgi:putative ABC transport system permease protein